MSIKQNKSTNPVLIELTKKGKSYSIDQTVTIKGITQKTCFLFLMIVSGFIYSFNTKINLSVVAPITFISSIVLIIAIIKNTDKAKYLAPIYGLINGALLGSLSLLLQSLYKGIISQAVLLTLIIFLITLGLYYFRIVKVTQRYKSVVIASTLGIGTYYIFSFFYRTFFHSVPFNITNSIPSIIFSVIVIAIASANLLLDFEVIEESVKNKVRKEYEWLASFGLITTLIWIYIESIQLIAKLRR